ncbi:MAG TPA: methylenetetrahydrofolate reductase [NAD(P)H] [Leucothrix mucor]|uniref:Methylenetetrahydrofolate reductase n=1 Tax=Leucothrix mucor TaxID=45248 RepID=A0A7V2T248_LEUMU|nr:methylenetetrahydrofolate reductase [NAD(P)H] [Leucothrix mucor]
MTTQKFSFEFFPPKTDKGIENLKQTRNTLAKLNPAFFSVTYGAGGTTQDCTLETVISIQKESGIDAAPHLSCIGSSKAQMRDILETYKDNDVKRIVALRGDIPSGMQDIGDFHYANELVSFIREQTGDHFHLEVAAYPEKHPQAKSYEDDLKNFVRKVKAGSNSAITQYFYNIDAFNYFRDDCEKQGVDIPIVPGIMPITNFTNLARFSDACGAEIPRWLRSRLDGYGDDTDSIKKLGAEFVTEMCAKLLAQDVAGLHFYSMNRVEPSLSIWNNLGLSELK